jgi:hypothetical protein
MNGCKQCGMSEQAAIHGPTNLGPTLKHEYISPSRGLEVLRAINEALLDAMAAESEQCPIAALLLCERAEAIEHAYLTGNSQELDRLIVPIHAAVTVRP